MSLTPPAGSVQNRNQLDSKTEKRGGYRGTERSEKDKTLYQQQKKKIAIILTFNKYAHKRREGGRERER